MPAKMLPPSRSLAIRLSRNSSLTCRARKRCSENGLWRNSPSVRGKLMTGNPQGQTELLLDYTLALDVTVATRLAANAYSSLQLRQNGFKVRNDTFQSLRLGLHS